MATQQNILGPQHAVHAPYINNNGNMKYNKKVLTSLGISEVILGSLSIVLSCIYLAYVYGPNGYFCHDCYYTWNTGEGIWCGVWILVGGSLGIASGQERSTATMMRTHFGFSIVGALFAAVMSAMSIVTALMSYSDLAIGLEVIIAIEGFAALGLCITSAVFSNKTIPGQSFASYGTCQQQAPFSTNNQSLPHVQQGYLQQQPVFASGQQIIYPVNFVTATQPGGVQRVHNNASQFVQVPGFQQQAQATSLHTQRLAGTTPPAKAMNTSTIATFSGDPPPSYRQDQ